MNQVLMLDRMLRDAAAKSAKLAEARSNMPPGSSRARVTTANAKWARAAEAREWLATRLRDAVEALRDPAEIAEVLAGVLRARGVTVCAQANRMEYVNDCFVATDRTGMHVVASRRLGVGASRHTGLAAEAARAAILRIAATTTAEDAVKALEGT